MRIRDANALISGDRTEFEMLSGELEVIADDGKTLFSIKQGDDGTLAISAANICKQHGEILNDTLTIIPRASNLIYIRRSKYY